MDGRLSPDGALEYVVQGFSTGIIGQDVKEYAERNDVQNEYKFEAIESTSKTVDKLLIDS